VTKVMIIEDSRDDMQMLEAILRKQAYQVVTVLNGDGAEATIAAEKPDLIMLDIVMPQRNGYEILRSIKRDAFSKTIPVIVVSSKGEDTDVSWGKRQGAADYVVKPYTSETVLSVVNKIVKA
jgi:twitching motility two-component system response regulator PilH